MKRNILVCVPLLFAGAASVALAVEVPSLETLAATPAFGRVRLAPDGQHLALTRSSERGSSLLILRSDTFEVSTELKFPSHSHVLDVHWATADMLVIARGQRFAGAQRAGPANTGELYSVSIDGSKQNYLFGGRAGSSKRNKGREGDPAVAWIIDSLPADPRRVLIGESKFVTRRSLQPNPRLHRIDVYSGARELVTEVPLQFPWISVDHAGQVRFAYGRDERRRQKTLSFDADKGTWSDFDLGLGEFGSIRPLAFSADNRDLYASVSEQGEPGCVYRINTTDKSRTRLTCESQAEVERLMPTSRPGTPLAAVFTSTGTRSHLLDGDSQEAQLFRVLAQKFAPSVADFVEFDRAGDRLLLRVEGDRDPGRYYLYDARQRENRLVFARSPGLAADQLGPTEHFALRARDGTPLHGFLTVPPQGPRRALPLVVMPHGGPYGIADDASFDAEAQLLATRGFAVMKINFRGSGGHGELFMRQGFQQWGLAIQDDIVDATRWLIEQGVVDGQRVCIVGASFGAYSALMSAAREPALFRCAVGVAGIYDLDMMFRRGDIRDTEHGRAYLEEVLGKDADALQAQSPVAQAGNIQAAVMLVHGEGDARAPIAQVKGLAAALKEQGREPEMLVIPGEGHGFFLARNRVLYFRRLLEFLQRNISPDAA